MTKRPKKTLPRPLTTTRKALSPGSMWDAPPGCKVVVLDRGAVSFNVPESWVITDIDPTLIIRDAAVPDDEMGIHTSVIRGSPLMDFSGLPLDGMVLGAMQANAAETNDPNMTLELSELHRVRRGDLEIVWMSRRFIDASEQREAISRTLVGRGFGIHAVLTFSYWVADARIAQPIWDEVLRSLDVGRTITDPTHGPVLH